MKKRFLNRIKDKFLQKRFPENLVPKKTLKRNGKQMRGRDQILSLSGRPISLSSQLRRGTRKTHQRRLLLASSPMSRIDTLERGSIVSSSAGIRILSSSKTWYPREGRSTFPRHRKCLLPTSFFGKRLEKKPSLYSSSQLESAWSRQQEKRSSPLLLRLMEKKKLRILYGNLSNREVNSLIRRAAKGRGRFGDILFRLLESRLDVVLSKIGFSSTIPFARQSVYHGKVLINQKVMTMANYLLQPGDVISILPAECQLLKKHIVEKAEAFTNFSSRNLESQFEFKKSSLTTAGDWGGISTFSPPLLEENPIPLGILQEIDSPLSESISPFQHTDWRIFPWFTVTPFPTTLPLDSTKERKVSFTSFSAAKKVEIKEKAVPYFSNSRNKVARNQQEGQIDQVTLKKMVGNLTIIPSLAKSLLPIPSMNTSRHRGEKVSTSDHRTSQERSRLAAWKSTHGLMNMKTKLRFFSLKLPHVEISFALLTAVYLYPAQRVCLPAIVDTEKILSS